MAAIYSLHECNLGTSSAPANFFFNTSDAYAGLTADTGVSKVANPTGQEVVTPVKELTRTGKLVRLSLKVKNGAAIYYASLLIARNKLPSLFPTATTTSLDNKPYMLNGANRGTIQTVHFERDRVYRY